jgi:hypothetical protein
LGAEFGIPDKYFTPGDARKLSLHQGYARKFISFKPNLRHRLMELLHEDLKIVPFDILAEGFSDKDRNLRGLALKSHVDHVRKCTYQIYCTGHSQGGGVAQVTVAYLTTLLGEYLYGPNFDNKEFNSVYGVFISPARAWGNKSTRAVYENVVGVNNMIGYSSVMDIVTCMPLGHNIEKDKANATMLSVGKHILRGLAPFFTPPYNELVKLICNSENSYETLTHWCFEDPVRVFTEYCKSNIATINLFVGDVKAGKLVVDNEAPYVKSLLEVRKKFKDFFNNKRQAEELRTLIKEVQEAYFFAHKDGFLFVRTKRNFHALKAIAKLKKVIEICMGPEHFIASQHLGAYAYNHVLADDGLIKTNLGPFFNAQLLSFDLQRGAEDADIYFAKKESMTK